MDGAKEFQLTGPKHKCVMTYNGRWKFTRHRRARK